MFHFPLDPAVRFIVEMAVRSTCILGVTLLASWAMARRSAAERHLVLVAGLAAVLLLPFGWLGAPQWIWKMPARPAEQPVAATQVARSEFDVGTLSRSMISAEVKSVPVGSQMQIEPAKIFYAAIALGMLVQAAGLAVGWWELRRIRRRAARFELPSRLARQLTHREAVTPVLISPDVRVAFIVGWLRPVMVLPKDAGEWDEQRLEIVLWHELAHLRRGDHRVHPFCSLARVLYWWHPLAWPALARLRFERERACDDLVIERFRPSDYADVLVMAARAAAARRPGAALAMATGSRIEGRVCAILDGSKARGTPTRCLLYGTSVAAVTATALLCAVRLVRAEDSVEKPAPVPAAASMQSSAPKLPVDFKVRVETRFFEMAGTLSEPQRRQLASLMEAKPLSASEFNDRLKALGAIRDEIGLMSARPVNTPRGNGVQINITQDFKYGVDFKKNSSGKLEPTRAESRKLGIELEVVPTVHGDTILLTGSVKLTEFEGFTKGEEGIEMPVFDVKEMRLLREMGDGQTVGIWAFDRTDEMSVINKRPDGTETTSRQTVKKRLGMFLTAKLVDPAAEPQSASPIKVLAASAARKSSGSKPYGSPVAAKPGFVTSPFEPYAGFVDVRGFPPNTEVKCPYSGKIFLVP